MTTIAWWSGGVTSAVACKKAIELYSNVRLVYIHIDSHHEDTLRFKVDCEKWYGVKIEQIQAQKYSSHFDVIDKEKYINGPSGARCTKELKRRVRENWEKDKNIQFHVWGFESGEKEKSRAERIKLAIPLYGHKFPLIELGLDKRDCIKIIQDAKIEIPMMYKLGFNNNNCVGCVKGGMAYWNKIRTAFPNVFNDMAKREREIGRSCIRAYFLDELPVDAGRGQPPLVSDCGSTGEGCITQMSRDYYNRD
jgi:hypothetical protein